MLHCLSITLDGESGTVNGADSNLSALSRNMGQLPVKCIPIERDNESTTDVVV